MSPAPLVWPVFAVVDGRFLAGRAQWDVKSDVLVVSVRGGITLSARVRRDDCRAVAKQLLAALEWRA